MRKAWIVAALLVCLPGISEAQSCDGCGIGYRAPGGLSQLTTDGAAITSTLPILLPAGSASAPALAFSAESDLGLFRITSGKLQFADGTAGYINFSNAGIGIRNTTSFYWAASGGPENAGDLFLNRDAAATLQLGADAATATAQAIKAPDSTGANVGGASLTLRGGSGTSGNATGGQLILGGGANAGTGERGAVQIEDGGTQPTCAAGIRGSIWYDAGGAGVADTFEVCAKAAAGDAYAWRALATIP